MFDENSGLVKTWVRLLKKKNSKYTIDDVPEIDNLVDVVKQAMGIDNK